MRCTSASYFIHKLVWENTIEALSMMWKREEKRSDEVISPEGEYLKSSKLETTHINPNENQKKIFGPTDRRQVSSNPDPHFFQITPV